MRRDIEQKLLEWKNSSKRKPLIIKGARQVGKTYSLKKFGAENFKRCHYINLEKQINLQKVFDKNLSPINIINELSLALNTEIDIKEDLLILDEIQAAPQALTSLKYFCEEKPELAICAAGSLLGLKLSPVSFPVGKVEYLHMYPLCFNEFLEAIGEAHLIKTLEQSLCSQNIPEMLHDKLLEYLKIYFIVGGLPEVVETYRSSAKSLLLSKFQECREKQEEVIGTYLDDMTKHSGKENSMHIERLWKDIPTQLARKQDSSAPKFNFKGIIPGIQAYSRLVGAIDWLEATGLIIKVKIVKQSASPLSAFTKENRFKLFMFDVGILGAVSSLQIQDIWNQDYGNYKGYYAENFVAQEFQYIKTPLESLYSWSEGESEIEFLKDSCNGIIPIEVKSGTNTQAKSLKSYINRYNPKYSVILSAKNYHIDESKQINYYPLYLSSKSILQT